MTVFERKTPFGDEETGVEVCRKSRQMLYFFADSPIPATSMPLSNWLQVCLFLLYETSVVPYSLKV